MFSNLSNNLSRYENTAPHCDLYRIQLRSRTRSSGVRVTQNEPARRLCGSSLRDYSVRGYIFFPTSHQHNAIMPPTKSHSVHENLELSKRWRIVPSVYLKNVEFPKCEPFYRKFRKFLIRAIINLNRSFEYLLQFFLFSGNSENALSSPLEISGKSNRIFFPQMESAKRER